MRKVYVDSGKRKQKIIYQSYSVENAFIQMYTNIGDAFYRVKNHSSLYLLIWIVVNMNTINEITLNRDKRDLFVSDVISKGGKRYSDASVKRSIKELKDAGILISNSDNDERLGSYMINPSYFWRSKHQSERLQLIESFKFKKENNEGN